MPRFLWASLVLEIVLNDCDTQNEVKNAILKLPTDLEKLYTSCLQRKRGSKLLGDHVLILTVCASPQPMSANALCQLLAMDMTTGDVAPADILSPDAVIQHGVGLITLDKTEQLILPAHDSVRTFIFSRVAPMSKRIAYLKQPSTFCDTATLAIFNDLAPDRTKSQEITTRTHLGYACILHLRHKASRALVTSSSQSLQMVPTVTSDMPSWIRRPLKAFWLDSPRKRTVSVSRPRRNYRAPAQQDEFFNYARDNWLPCRRHLSTIKSSDSSQWKLFSSMAIERNESWDLHPWPVLAPSRAQHLAGMFAYSVANGHLPLLQLPCEHKSSLPKGIFDGLLSDHGHLPALHVACHLGHSQLLPHLLSVCNPFAICPMSRTALHYAAESGHIDCVTAFLAHGKHLLAKFINQRDSRQSSALDLALLNGHEHMAIVLANECGADLIIVQNRGRTSHIDVALDQGLGHFVETILDEIQLAELLSIDPYGPYEFVSLLSAAEAGRTKCVQTLCRLISAHDGGHQDPIRLRDAIERAIHTAVTAGHVGVVRVLLESNIFAHLMSISSAGRVLPFASAVDAHYEEGKSLLGAKAMVGLLTQALIRLQRAGPAEETHIPGALDAVQRAFKAAAQIGHAEAVQQLLNLWNEPSMTSQRDGMAQRAHYLVEKFTVSWAHLGIGTASLPLPTFWAAVRQHEEVLALLLPDYDALRIKELMVRAQSVNLEQGPPM